MKRQIKDGVRTLLQRLAPKLLAHLAQLRRQRDPNRTLSTHWQPATKVPHPPSDLHPVLSDPTLALLERPADLEMLRIQTETADHRLEPVTELGQMRLSAAPVCFVLPVSQLAPDHLERTIQSLLRQTDPSWELLLCTSERLDAQLDRWLDVDWRVRRFVHVEPKGEFELLVEAAVQATTPFLGLIRQGDTVDDDLVKAIGIHVAASPRVDLVFTDEASQAGDVRAIGSFIPHDGLVQRLESDHALRRFLAVRKSRLFQVALPASRKFVVAGQPNCAV